MRIPRKVDNDDGDDENRHGHDDGSHYQHHDKELNVILIGPSPPAPDWQAWVNSVKCGPEPPWSDKVIYWWPCGDDKDDEIPTRMEGAQALLYLAVRTARRRLRFSLVESGASASSATSA